MTRDQYRERILDIVRDMVEHLEETTQTYLDERREEAHAYVVDVQREAEVAAKRLIDHEREKLETAVRERERLEALITEARATLRVMQVTIDPSLIA